MVLAAASAFAVARRRRDGAFRPTATSGEGGPAATVETGTAPTIKAGTAPTIEAGTAAAPAGAGPDALLAALGVIMGTPVTLLQFSSAFCAPCRATRVICAETATLVPGVRHLEIDAESHLDAVRALDIWRTPTVLLVDAQGRIRQRATGAPNRAQLLSAIASLLPGDPTPTTGGVSPIRPA